MRPSRSVKKINLNFNVAMCFRRDVVNKEAQLLSRVRLVGGVPQRAGISQGRPQGLGAQRDGVFLHPHRQPMLDSRTKALDTFLGSVGEPEIDLGCPGNCMGPEVMKEVSSLEEFMKVPTLWSQPDAPDLRAVLFPDGSWKQPGSPTVLCKCRGWMVEDRGLVF